jgi:hypothetical protein
MIMTLSNAALNAVSGAALGAFLALLIGLSHSPVVAPVLSVLSAAAVIYLALTDALPF